MLQLNVEQATDAAQAIVKEFERRKKILDAGLVAVKRLLAFVFVKILFE
jgi:hypothetical protein